MVSVSLKVPKWIEEIGSPHEIFVDSLLSGVLVRVHEYRTEEEFYEHKYNMPFERFEKKLKKRNREDFGIYDDYIVWKGAHFLYKKWLHRYNDLMMGRS